MQYYLVTVSGRDDGYARAVGGYRIDEGQYIFNFGDGGKAIAQILNSIKQTADDAKETVLSLAQYEMFSREKLGFFAPHH